MKLTLRDMLRLAESKRARKFFVAEDYAKRALVEDIARLNRDGDPVGEPARVGSSMEPDMA